MIIQSILIAFIIIISIFTVVMATQNGLRQSLALGFIGLFLIILLFSPRFFVQSFKAEVISVNKNREGGIDFKLGESIAVKTSKKDGILSSFEIAVRRIEDNRIEVLKNTNSIIWWKFNQKAIQLDLEPGEIYEFKVDGWFGLRNIIIFQDETKISLPNQSLKQRPSQSDAP